MEEVETVQLHLTLRASREPLGPRKFEWIGKRVWSSTWHEIDKVSWLFLTSKNTRLMKMKKLSQFRNLTITFNFIIIIIIIEENLCVCGSIHMNKMVVKSPVTQIS